MMASVSGEFDFHLVVSKFKALAAQVEDSGSVPLDLYADAVAEFMKVFSALGSGFAFAFKDLGEKIDTLRQWASDCGDVRTLLISDVERGNKPPNDKVVDKKGKVSPSRAVNRTTHVCMFLTEIFAGLNKNPEASLYTTVSEAYEATLVTIHSFVVKNSVRLAFKLVPNRETFITKAKISEVDIRGKAPDFLRASQIVTALVQKEFTACDVPFVF